MRNQIATACSNALLTLVIDRRGDDALLTMFDKSIHILSTKRASAVYSAVVRHTARIAKHVSMRASVYTLRSDIRAVLHCK